ncbi:MAG TPA: AMP-dependent synthetase/ligase [Candidatus Acidoferrum sp.]|nr:AMP-dependent synthetase/ligase [Candidatus Acidoferrum sp.]
MNRNVAAERQAIDRAIEGKTLCSVFAETAARSADTEALRWRTPSGVQALTWSDYRNEVRNLAFGLRVLGFQRGGFAAILMRNRPEHVIADLAVVHAGGTPVSLYATSAPEQIAYIVNHCLASVMFVEDEGFMARVRAARDDMPHLRWIVQVEGATGETIDWMDLRRQGQTASAKQPGAFEELAQQVKPDDLATLIYTSGTTGPPKAVMIDHHNIAWTVESAPIIQQGERQISYLPMAHVAERFVGYWTPLFRGSTVTFCPDLAELGKYLAEVRPTFLFGPPRVWEKLHTAIQAALGAAPDDAQRQGIRSVILQKLGLDQCQVAMTGAAPIAPEVIDSFRGLGLPLTEIWGMSELTGPGSYRLDGFRLGTVGVSMPGQEVRLAEDGELLVRGGNVMRGYYRDTAKTAETIDADGWLSTGDVAAIDEEGNIRIIDRKKELIITSGGKNISPANLENLLKRHSLIGQACVIGDRRAYLVALVVLDGQMTAGWAQKQGIPPTTLAELSRRPELMAEIDAAVEAANRHVSRHEQIRRYAILPEEWTAESEELTPTLKLKRRVINEKYAGVIESLYASVAAPAPV